MKDSFHTNPVAPRSGFTALAIATAFAVLADAVVLLALAWELAASDRRGLLGALLAVSAATRLVLMPLGGALADRYDKVLLLRLSAVARVVTMAVLAWAVMDDRVTVAIVAMTLLGAATAVHYPADRALVVELVRQESLARANGTLQTIMNTGNVAGPALAAVFIGWVGGPSTLLLAGVGYLCGAVVLLFMPRRTSQDRGGGPEPYGLLTSMAQGVRYAWSDRSLFVLLVVVGTVNLGFLGPFSVAIPALVVDRLGGQPGVLAAIEAAFAGGSILGAALVALWWKKPGGLAVTVSIVMVALAMGVLATTARPSLAVAVMLLGGLGSGVANVVLVTAIQRRTPRVYIGRVMSTVTIVTMGLAPVSLAMTGLLLEVTGPSWIILGGGAVILLAAALAYRPARTVLRHEVAL